MRELELFLFWMVLGIQYADMAYGSALGFATVGANNGHNGTSGRPFLNNADIVEDFAFRSYVFALIFQQGTFGSKIFVYIESIPMYWWVKRLHNRSTALLTQNHITWAALLEVDKASSPFRTSQKISMASLQVLQPLIGITLWHGVEISS